MRDQHQDLIQKHGRPEDVSCRRIGRTLPAAKIVEIVCKELGAKEAELQSYCKGSALRPVAAKMFCKHGGLTQRAVAELFGLRTGAAVSAQLKWLKRAVGESSDVKRLLARTDRRLAQF